MNPDLRQNDGPVVKATGQNDGREKAPVGGADDAVQR